MSTMTDITAPGRAGRTPGSRVWWRRNAIWYAFVLPAFLLYALFVLYPFLESIRLSFTDWNGADRIKTFVGFDNYAALARDPEMWGALVNNLVMVTFGAPLAVLLGLIFALLLHDKPAGHTIFRTVFFMPLVLAPLVVGFIWVWILASRYGLLANTLDAFGVDRTAPRGGWLGNPDFALYAIIAAWVWSNAGFYFVILNAGLQNVDDDLLAAARIDGARGAKRFWHVTLPQIRPVLTVVLVLALAAAFKIFDLVYVMTGGGPANSTELLATYIYDKAFLESSVGYGAALSCVLAAIILLISLGVIWWRERGR